MEESLMRQVHDTRDYVHLAQQGQVIGWDIRSYSASESIIEYNHREVLLVEVEAGGCSFCDGSYAHYLSGVNIEGYIVNWKYRQNEDGLPVTEIEPVRDKLDRNSITEILKERYSSSQLNFT